MSIINKMDMNCDGCKHRGIYLCTNGTKECTNQSEYFNPPKPKYKMEIDPSEYPNKSKIFTLEGEPVDTTLGNKKTGVFEEKSKILEPLTTKYVLETKREGCGGYTTQKKEFDSFEELERAVDQLHVSYDILDIYQKMPYRKVSRGRNINLWK